jgi:hypothetical protein
VLSAPSSVAAQSPTPGPTLGIRGIGAFGVHAAFARVERGAEALEASATLDLGHFASNRVRLAADASFLRSLSHTEFIVADDSSYRDVFYDLSGHVTLGLLLRDPARTVVPYVGFGAGVHVLTSSFGSIPIDRRYNTNVFGLRSAAGVRFRVGRSGRQALVAEGQAILARHVSRGTARVGVEWLFGDLIRH